MLLGTMCASFFIGKILTGKEMNRDGEEIVRAGYGNEKVRKTTTKSKKNF